MVGVRPAHLRPISLLPGEPPTYDESLMKAEARIVSMRQRVLLSFVQIR